ncbi:hypothetical protein BH10PSE19_BH10PSE19_19490 [soil metagenome]
MQINTEANPIFELSSNHRRVITTMLWMLDDMLLVFERWCTKEETHSILFEEKNILVPEQRQNILAEIASLRILLTQMQQQLQLIPHVYDIARAISVRSTLFQTDALNALTSKELDKYGKVSSELESYLQPKLQEFIQRIDAIAKITGVHEGSE